MRILPTAFKRNRPRVTDHSPGSQQLRSSHIMTTSYPDMISWHHDSIISWHDIMTSWYHDSIISWHDIMTSWYHDMISWQYHILTWYHDMTSWYHDIMKSYHGIMKSHRIVHSGKLKKNFDIITASTWSSIAQKKWRDQVFPVRQADVRDRPRQADVHDQPASTSAVELWANCRLFRPIRLSVHLMMHRWGSCDACSIDRTWTDRCCLFSNARLKIRKKTFKRN